MDYIKNVFVNFVGALENPHNTINRLQYPYAFYTRFSLPHYERKLLTKIRIVRRITGINFKGCNVLSSKLKTDLFRKDRYHLFLWFQSFKFRWVLEIKLRRISMSWKIKRLWFKPCKKGTLQIEFQTQKFKYIWHFNHKYSLRL